MATPSLVGRVRHGLDGLLHRSHDADRERDWEMRQAEVDRERHESVGSPAPGMRGSEPYSFGHAKRH